MGGVGKGRGEREGKERKERNGELAYLIYREVT
jgi:hypothetical protein